MTDTVVTGTLPQTPTLGEVVKQLLPQGWAKLVQPIAASTITTDTQGLVAGEVQLNTMTGVVPAYRAHPDKNGKFPVVLVVQEIFGVHEHIKDVCRRLAKQGISPLRLTTITDRVTSPKSPTTRKFSPRL